MRVLDISPGLLWALFVIKHRHKLNIMLFTVSDLNNPIKAQVLPSAVLEIGDGISLRASSTSEMFRHQMSHYFREEL